MRKTVKYLQDVDKLRYQKNHSQKKSTTKKIVDQKSIEEEKKSKGNVTLEDLENDDNSENEKNYSKYSSEVLDIFEKPLEESISKKSKKRSFNESNEEIQKKKQKNEEKEQNDEEEENGIEKSKKQEKLQKFIEEAKSSEKYKMTGIQDTAGIDVSQGIVSLASEEKTNKRAKGHYFKDSESEKKIDKEEREGKTFKKGGKKKRKIKI